MIGPWVRERLSCQTVFSSFRIRSLVHRDDIRKGSYQYFDLRNKRVERMYLTAL